LHVRSVACGDAQALGNRSRCGAAFGTASCQRRRTAPLRTDRCIAAPVTLPLGP
jgi:hypothetical protein